MLSDKQERSSMYERGSAAIESRQGHILQVKPSHRRGIFATVGGIWGCSTAQTMQFCNPVRYCKLANRSVSAELSCRRQGQKKTYPKQCVMLGHEREMKRSNSVGSHAPTSLGTRQIILNPLMPIRVFDVAPSNILALQHYRRTVTD